MHSDIRPFAAAQADTLPGTPPTVSTDDEGCSIGHSAAYLSHRRADTAAMWRAARSWISLAYPAGLDVARAELVAKFPDLAANVARLEQAAQREATRSRTSPRQPWTASWRSVWPAITPRWSRSDGPACRS